MMLILKDIKTFVAAAVLLGAVTLFAAGAKAEDETNRFGFSGPEIFPIDSQISLLHVADLDGDWELN